MFILRLLLLFTLILLSLFAAVISMISALPACVDRAVSRWRKDPSIRSTEREAMQLRFKIGRDRK